MFVPLICHWWTRGIAILRRILINFTNNRLILLTRWRARPSNSPTRPTRTCSRIWRESMYQLWVTTIWTKYIFGPPPQRDRQADIYGQSNEMLSLLLYRRGVGGGPTDIYKAKEKKLPQNPNPQVLGWSCSLPCYQNIVSLGMGDRQISKEWYGWNVHPYPPSQISLQCKHQ